MASRPIKAVLVTSLLIGWGCYPGYRSPYRGLDAAVEILGQQSPQTPYDAGNRLGSYQQIKCLLQETEYVDTELVKSILHRVEATHEKPLTKKEKKALLHLLLRKDTLDSSIEDVILALAITSGSSSETLEWLIGEGAYINACVKIAGEKKPQTPFRIAVSQGSFEQIQCLLGHSEDITDLYLFIEGELINLLLKNDRLAHSEKRVLLRMLLGKNIKIDLFGRDLLYDSDLYPFVALLTKFRGIKDSYLTLSLYQRDRKLNLMPWEAALMKWLPWWKRSVDREPVDNQTHENIKRFMCKWKDPKADPPSDRCGLSEEDYWNIVATRHLILALGYDKASRDKQLLIIRKIRESVFGTQLTNTQIPFPSKSERKFLEKTFEAIGLVPDNDDRNTLVFRLEGYGHLRGHQAGRGR